MKDQYSMFRNQSQANYKRLSLVLPMILAIIFLSALIIPSLLLFLLMNETSKQERNTMTLFYSFFFLAINESQSLDQSQNTESLGYRNYCMGTSPGSMWQVNATYTMTMIVDTTICNFTDTPLYFLSVGNAVSYDHWCLTGENAIYFPTKQSFQIYGQSTCSLVPAATLASEAVTLEWDVNWIGFYK